MQRHALVSLFIALWFISCLSKDTDSGYLPFLWVDLEAPSRTCTCPECLMAAFKKWITVDLLAISGPAQVMQASLLAKRLLPLETESILRAFPERTSESISVLMSSPEPHMEKHLQLPSQLNITCGYIRPFER